MTGVCVKLEDFLKVRYVVGRKEHLKDEKEDTKKATKYIKKIINI